MTATLALSTVTYRPSTSPIVLLPKRFLSSTIPLPGFTRATRFTVPAISHSVVVFNPARVNPIRCRAKRSGSAKSPLPPTKQIPLSEGSDFEHWLIVMDKPGGEGATKQQMIDCYIQTLASAVGSEEDAKKKIYNVSCERYFGFGCEIDLTTSTKLVDLAGVLLVLPDSYVDLENKDYGAELLVNGKIFKRSRERQRKVDSVLQRLKVS